MRVSFCWCLVFPSFKVGMNQGENSDRFKKGFYALMPAAHAAGIRLKETN